MMEQGLRTKVREMKAKQKHIMSIITALFISGILLMSGCTEQTTDTGKDNNEEEPESGYYLYEDIQEGFNIEYPVTWMIREDLAEQNNLSVLFMSQSQEQTDIGSFMIIVEELEGYMEWFKEAHMENLSESPQMPGLTISDENTTTLAGIEAYTILFTFQYDTYTWKQQEIWTIENNTLYLLTFQSDQACYEEFTDIIDYMIASFEIL